MLNHCLKHLVICSVASLGSNRKQYLIEMPPSMGITTNDWSLSMRYNSHSEEYCWKMKNYEETLMRLFINLFNDTSGYGCDLAEIEKYIADHFEKSFKPVTSENHPFILTALELLLKDNKLECNSVDPKKKYYGIPIISKFKYECDVCKIDSIFEPDMLDPSSFANLNCKNCGKDIENIT